MFWVEIISVRLPLTADDKLLKNFFSDTHHNITDSAEEQVDAMVYRNGFVENDWAIHLHRFSENRTPEKTRLGLILAENLRSFGLVEHMIWIEEEK